MTQDLGRKGLDAIWLAAGEDLRSFSQTPICHGTAAHAIFNGIAIDGKILIDAGAQWDTSQVWSDSQIQTCDYGWSHGNVDNIESCI